MRRSRLALTAFGAAVAAQSEPVAALPAPVADACRAHAPEAAERSGVDVGVLLRVMQAESGGNSGVVSVKGAIGCMQIMPTTWRTLSRRYSLGADLYEARMNMIGGALYLAELARRFGWPGAYAAYNAGPARYVRYAATGIPLPAETVAYVKRLGGATAPAVAASPHIRWQEAQLFLMSPGDLRNGRASARTDAGPTLFPPVTNAASVER